MAEALEAGSAYLALMASARGLQGSVNKQVKKVKAPDIVAKIDAEIAALEGKAAKARATLEKIQRAGADPQLDLDISELTAKAAVVRERLDELGKKNPTPKVRADIASAEAQLGRITARLAALEQKKVDARVGVEMSELESKLARARQQLDALSKKEATPQVRADTNAAQAKIDAISARLDQLKYENPTARVDADTARAVEQLRTVEAQITRLNGQRASVQANADGAPQALAQLAAVDQKRQQVDGSNASVSIAASGGAQASGILGAIVAGVSAIAAASPAAASALSVVLNLGTGAAQAAGAITSGFSGVGDAIKAVEADEKSAATSSSGASASRVNSANQIASAQSALSAAVMQADRAAITGAEQVADAARAEAQAAVNADRARITSAQQVAAARRALADAIVSAAERAASAERAVGRAQESVRFAQEALTRARRDAVEANEDLQLSLSGIAISERRALLAQKKARAALAKGAEDPLEREELQLNIDEADQNLKEIRERYGDLRQEQAAFARGGVEGSAQVTAATRSLNDAQTSAADAQRALTAAQRDGSRQVADAAAAAAQTQQQAAWTVADAQTAQADAARATARAARDAGWAQQDAARGVADAQRGLQQALAATAQGAGAAGAAGKQSAFELAKLTPAGRDFVDFWTKTWKPSMEDVSNTVAGELLPRIQTSMFRLLGLQPELKNGLAGTARVIGDLAMEGSNLATSPAFRRDFVSIMDSNNRSLQSWGKAGLYGVDAARALTVAGLPLSERLARTAESAMRGVSSFMLQKEASGELGRFMQFAGDKGAQLWGVLVDLATGAYELAVAVAPVGNVVLELIGGFGRLVAEVSQTYPGFVQLAVGGGIAVAALNALAKAAVAAQASALLSGSGLTALSAGLLRLGPTALNSTTAMTRLGAAFTAAGSMTGGFVAGMGGSSAAALRADRAVSGVGSALRGTLTHLPVIGLALIAAGAAFDGLTTSSSEAVEKLMAGKTSFRALTDEISWQTAVAESYRSTMGDTLGDAFGKLVPGIREVTAEFAEQLSQMTQLEQMQVLSKMALKGYEDALLQHGAGSREAAAAQTTYRNSVRNVEIAQIAVREKTDSATAAMLWQRDQTLAAIDADLRFRLSKQQLGKDQDALNKALREGGPASQAAIDAGLQLEMTQRRTADAAKSGAGGQQAFVQSLRDMVTASKGQLTPALSGMVSTLNHADLAAAGAKLEFDAAGQAVARFPGNKVVRLDANTSPVYPALQAVKLAVDSTRGTIGVDADTGPGTMQVGNFKLQTDMTRGVVAIDGNISPADQQRLGIKAKTDGTTGTMWINGNPVPADGALNGARFRVDHATGVMTVDANPNPANVKTDDAHRRASAPAAPMNVDANTAPAEGTMAKLWRKISSWRWWLGIEEPPPPGRAQGGYVGRAMGGLVEAYATGGRVRAFPSGGGVSGPGGPTADKIPAMLSNGEYVIRAAAVKKLGVPTLDALNAMRDGGIVAPLHLAGGGATPKQPPSATSAPAAPAAAPTSAPAAASSAAVSTPSIDTGADGAATASTSAMAGSLTAATAAAGALTPALAALATVQTGLLVPAQSAVTLGQQMMATTTLTTLLPTMALAQQAIGVQAPLAHQALQLSQFNTRLSTDQTALNTGMNSTLMSGSIAAMSIGSQFQLAGLRSGQFLTRLDTDQTRLNRQLNDQSMMLSTQTMSMQGQFQHGMLRGGQMLTQQHTNLTAQNAALNNANMMATTGQMSAVNQGHLAGLRGGQAVTSNATTAFADAFRAQMARTQPDSANPIRWVINYPIKSITDAWNHLDAQFALGKRVPPYVPNFARGGVFSGSGQVSGPGGPTDDRVNARLSDGEFVVRESVARAHMPFLNALNHGQVEAKQAAGGRHATMPGYAGGGVVAAQQFARSTAGKPYVWGAVGPNGYDCCVPANTLVSSPDGPQRICDLSPGDMVWSFVDGEMRAHPVVAQWFAKRQMTYRVRTRNRSVEASANHPFLVLRKQVEGGWRATWEDIDWDADARQPYGAKGHLTCTLQGCTEVMHAKCLCIKHHKRLVRNGDPRRSHEYVPEHWGLEWTRLDQLAVGDLTVIETAQPDGASNDVMPDGTLVTEDLAWLVGAVTGDGHLTDDSIRLAVHGSVRERAVRVFKDWTGKSYIYGNDSTLIVHSRRHRKLLEDLGLRVLAPNKRVPRAVWSWSRKLQEAFLNGYCDTDGHRPKGSHVRYGDRVYRSASRALLADIRAMHIAHGDRVGNCGVADHRRKPIRIAGNKSVVDAKPLWSFAVYPDDQTYAKRRTQRRASVRDTIVGWGGAFTTQPVLAIDALEVTDTYDITVEGSHNFVADGVVVHNSGLWSAITNVARGQAPHRRLGTASSNPWGGFRPGLNSALSVGANSGHMAGTIGGLNAEAQQRGVPVKVGGGAAGADNGQFRVKASLPQVGGTFVSGGPGGGGGGFDPTPIVDQAFAKAYREIADIPKHFGPSPQVARDQGVARKGADGVKAKALAKLQEMFAAAGIGPLGAGHPFYVREISRAAKVRGLGIDGATIGVATALVESQLKMYANRSVPASLRFPHDAIGSDHDSVGLFQQRQAGWGSIEQRMNAFGSASLFFNKLASFNWRGMAPGAAAQKVQVSAFPGRYAGQMGRARQLVGMHGGPFDSGGLAYGKGVMVKDTNAPERVLDPVQTGQYDTLGQLVGRNGIRVEGLDQAVNAGGQQPLVGRVENHYHGDQRGGDMRDLAHTLRRVRVQAGA